MLKAFNSRFFKALCFCTAFCILTASLSWYMGKAVPAEAKTIDEMQKEIDAKEKEQKELTAKLNTNAKGQKDEKEKQVLLTQQIKSVEDQLTLLSDKIDVVSQNVSDLEAEIDDKLAEIDDNEELFAKRVRAMYIQNRSSSTLSTLLSAKSFSQFLNNSEILKRISESDRDLIKTLDVQKQELTSAKEELEREKADLLSSQESYKSKSSSLDGLYSQSQSDEAKLKLSEKKYVEEMAANEAEIAKLEDEVRAAIAAAGNDGEMPSEFAWPLPSSSRVTSGYGWRTLWGKQDFHLGIDIAAPAGTNIAASAAGEVILVQKANTGYGWRVVLNHGGGYSTLYAHTSRIDVVQGQQVAQGETIAGVGTTGASTGNHLHFEVRLNGVQDDPMKFVRKPQ